MKNIILATLAAGLLIAGANTADAKGHHGHHGGGHRGGFSGGHHGDRHGFRRFPHCQTRYGWRNGHYATARFCKTSFW